MKTEKTPVVRKGEEAADIPIKQNVGTVGSLCLELDEIHL